VHGYVAFDPLRQALIEADRLPPKRTGRVAPLTLVKTAVEEKGFLGVKLYPPMGFQAHGNAGRSFPYAREILEDRFGTVGSDSARILGRELDRALERLYDYCFDNLIPIMAHGGNSIAANECSGRMADPTFWLPVFDRKHPQTGASRAPAVMLAHFGGFDQKSTERGGTGCTPDPTLSFEDTWEAVICRYVKARPGCAVYADISMFTEVFGDSARVRAQFEHMLKPQNYPAMRDHLVFGTDWSMLALKNGASRYTHEVRAFLARVLGTDADGLQAILRRNFLRFASLSSSGLGYERLARVYEAADAPLKTRLRARLSAALA
jgi:hypothetical protein